VRDIMHGNPAAPVRQPGRWPVFLALVLAWLVPFAASLFMHRDDIATLRFGDPDDMMRLVEVRDFLAGQSWFDVSQHRVNPPLGGPMHWSRLVDLPIAGVILLLRPWVGAHGAEVGAILAVPALTLAVLLYALYRAVRPLLGRGRALVCCAAFAISPFIFVQCAAMRIDHHAWQAVAMAWALAGILHADARRGGVVAGLAMAVWLQISIEGLAFAALAGVVMTVRHTLDGREWPRLGAYLWTLALACLVLPLGLQGWRGAVELHCDSMSPVYLGPLAVLPPLASALHGMFAQNTPMQRASSVALAAGATLAAFLVTGTRCFAGPFDMLDPVVYRFWYLGVVEGLPIWRQDAETALIVILPAAVGSVGSVAAAWRERDRARRADWISLAVLGTGALGLAVLVMRTGFVAHLLAMPGATWLAAAAFRRARALRTASLRIPATIVSVMLLFPFVVAPLTSAAWPGAAPGQAQVTIVHLGGSRDVAALEQIPPATLFAPIDMGPSILLRTRHAVVATAHHRNAQGMKVIIDAFLAAPEDARAIVLRSSATYLVVAPMGETDRYRAEAPHGLAAQLLDGRCPAWLTPMSVPVLHTLRLYRIDRSGRARASDLRQLDRGRRVQSRRVVQRHGAVLRPDEQHDLRAAEDDRLGTGVDEAPDHAAVGVA
jgi:hypothetical protein